MEEDSVATFAAITGATTHVARGFLQLTSGDTERAVELFFENPDLVSGVGAGVPPSPGPTASAATGGAATSRSNIGRQDSSGVIHIDSDDDMDVDYIDDNSDRDDNDDDEDERLAATQAAAFAQEEEDAAMAKRLQEELYSENGGGGSGAGAGAGAGFGADDVRAPIARTTETLVAPNPAWGGEEDISSTFLEQMRRRRAAPGRFCLSS
jgi:hypothetical protein